MPLHYDGEVRIVKVNMGPFNNNGYIVSCPETKEGILIDTPAEPELLLNEVGDVSIKAILITHNPRTTCWASTKSPAASGPPSASPPPTRARYPRPPRWN